MDVLGEQHSHPRDVRISFDEGPHIYTIDGVDNKIAKYVSVTTWNHSHFKEFDADAVITNMMNSKKWEQSKYFGKTREEIKGLWEKNGDDSANAGTKMHYDIECYYNGHSLPENNSLENEYFKNFVRDFERDFGKDLKPYRTEWMVFHEELKFAGSIDMVFENEDGTLSIYDWKRCKEIKKINNWNEFSHTSEISHLPDTNYWHYCLQLNIYKAILEEKYEKKVKELYLVCLHPENKNKNYQRIKVVDLENEIKDLFQLRTLQLQNT